MSALRPGRRDEPHDAEACAVPGVGSRTSADPVSGGARWKRPRGGRPASVGAAGGIGVCAVWSGSRSGRGISVHVGAAHAGCGAVLLRTSGGSTGHPQPCDAPGAGDHRPAEMRTPVTFCVGIFWKELCSLEGWTERAVTAFCIAFVRKRKSSLHLGVPRAGQVCEGPQRW